MASGFYHIFATGALNGSGVLCSSGAISSAICVLLACITKALARLGALLIRAILFVGASASSAALLRFRPRLTVSAVSSSTSSVPLGR